MSPALIEHRKGIAMDVARKIAAESRLPIESIIGDDLSRDVVAARHRWWTELHELGMSLVAIGRVTGWHHTSVLNGIRMTRVRRLAKVVEAAAKAGAA